MTNLKDSFCYLGALSLLAFVLTADSSAAPRKFGVMEQGRFGGDRKTNSSGTASATSPE